MSEPSHQQQPNGKNPALTVILVVDGQRERAARALRSMLNQSIIDQMEILLFDLAPQDLPLVPGSDHPRVRLIRSGPEDLLVKARVRGIHAAKSPIVSFMEEHCEMQPGWAEVVIAAHREPWAAVGTDFINANPGAGSSDKAFRMNYGAYVRPRAERGPVSMIGGQNCSFKRDVLLRYEPHLELMLNADLVILRRMQQDGYRLFYDPTVQIAHRNETSLRSLAVGAFYWNWCYSNVRARVFQWGILRRACWIALTPLIPWVRLAKIGFGITSRENGSLGQFLRDIPFVFAISHCSAAGQAAGLLNQIDRAARAFSHFEMNEPRLSAAELGR